MKQVGFVRVIDARWLPESEFATSTVRDFPTMREAKDYLYVELVAEGERWTANAQPNARGEFTWRCYDDDGVLFASIEVQVHGTVTDAVPEPSAEVAAYVAEWMASATSAIKSVK